MNHLKKLFCYQENIIRMRTIIRTRIYIKIDMFEDKKIEERAEKIEIFIGGEVGITLEV